MFRLVSYSDRSAPALSIGCLPAAVFGVVVGTPVVFTPHQSLPLFPSILVLGVLCGLITWATHATVRMLAAHGRAAAWGVAAGFVLAAALVAALVALLITVTT